MATSGNPAQRLYDIISGANRAWGDVRSTGNQQPNQWQVWSKFFEIDISGNDRDAQLELIHRLEECSKLVDDVESLLVANDGIDHAKYLKSFPKYRALFSTPAQLTDTFQYAGITTDDITRLEFCLDAVGKVYHERVVDEDKLDELLAEVRSLYSVIVAEDFSHELKRVLLDMLHTMECAIHEYRIRGTGRLHEAVERLVGLYVMNKDSIESSHQKETGEVKHLLSRFAGLYSFAADTVQLLEAGSKYAPFLLLAAEVVSK